ncbi:cysteine proteinase inhibitor 5-like [Solanum tuberosum]|uniref:cysteine proteinase inhibitor 5-like n=1 Tax=Solanum tuberosum TaxID=4113 RepID=UPI00073A1318|nr:PREDICTED: cysteine proteinase inhibitor 5-like [Solanum tuberosum]
MAIKFNSILGILLVVVATVLLHVSEVQGGRKIVINGDDWVDIPNVQDPKIVEVGRFAIHEINKEAKTELVFLKVIAGQSQIKSTEATINFKLLISALDRDSPHYYQVMVSDKEQGKSRNLTSFKECTKFDQDIYMCK